MINNLNCSEKNINTKVLWKYIDSHELDDDGIKYNGDYKLKIISLENTKIYQMQFHNESTMGDLTNFIFKKMDEYHSDKTDLFLFFNNMKTFLEISNISPKKLLTSIPNLIFSKEIYIFKNAIKKINNLKESNKTFIEKIDELNSTNKVQSNRIKNLLSDIDSKNELIVKLDKDVDNLHNNDAGRVVKINNLNTQIDGLKKINENNQIEINSWKEKVSIQNTKIISMVEKNRDLENFVTEYRDNITVLKQELRDVNKVKNEAFSKIEMQQTQINKYKTDIESHNYKIKDYEQDVAELSSEVNVISDKLINSQKNLKNKTLAHKKALSKVSNLNNEIIKLETINKELQNIIKAKDSKSQKNKIKSQHNNIYSIKFPNEPAQKYIFNSLKDARHYIEDVKKFIYYSIDGNEITITDSREVIEIKLRLLNNDLWIIKMYTNSTVEDLMNKIEKKNFFRYKKKYQQIFLRNKNICDKPGKMLYEFDIRNTELILIFKD